MSAVPTVPAGPPEVEVAAVHQLVLRHAARLAGKPALLDAATGDVITYAALARGVERVAAALAARGFGPGDVLAVHSTNRPDYALAVYGAMAAGGTATGSDPSLTVAELATRLADAGARLLVTEAPLLEPAAEAARRAGVEEVLVFGGTFGALVEHDHPPATAVAGQDRAVAALPYSSGTSGLAKGVELTHAAVVANVRQALAVLDFTEDDVVLAVAPFCHVIGLNLLMTGGLAAGATVVTLPRFDLEPFLRAIQDRRVTLTIVVPPVVRALAGHPLVDRFDLSSLRNVGVGAAPLDAATEQRCAQRLGCGVSQGLGMTETTALIAVGDPRAPRRGSVGRPLPGTEVRVVDPGTGADLGPGRTGELWVRGPQLMRGYRGRPQETAATLDADGWLHTGDLGHVDDDGHVYVVDRLKELIKYRGQQVPPAELEQLLCTHPAVADAVVVPRPDPDAGEVPVAHVVLRSPVDAEELLRYVAERVAPFKRLAAVTVIPAVPRSPTGKPLRRLLAEAERAPR
ncbi:AMP-binding protein [Dactylosporangium aurantiacum]|uniref:AMP-binding protein n=1 Tax=Dactylosporangium aurantiacum TaxID=35754 RepID=A0A9Q9IAS4_9ACTN|nr:AMP-binding protein [Dactylosporangium aurantiacum]MDG6105111.1 AMP-binding protein [Dactylosporangium aurantiacum]UWZ51636.1 AMP-binding protein [Dactylosporangium aurantiacum]